MTAMDTAAPTARVVPIFQMLPLIEFICEIFLHITKSTYKTFWSKSKKNPNIMNVNKDQLAKDLKIAIQRMPDRLPANSLTV